MQIIFIPEDNWEQMETIRYQEGQVHWSDVREREGELHFKIKQEVARQNLTTV